MLRLPVLAQLVRLVGGPTGSMLGAVGPTGPQASSFMGPTGLVGSLGKMGPTGIMGAAGLALAFMGATGVKGPGGSDGVTGTTGPLGDWALPPGQLYFFENQVGFSGFRSDTEQWVGCKFTYQVAGGVVLIICTGIYHDLGGAAAERRAYISLEHGTGPAPQPGLPTGNQSQGWGVSTEVKALNASIPFALVIGDAYRDSGRQTGETLWIDLSVYLESHTVWENAVVAGGITDINCMVLEM